MIEIHMLTRGSDRVVGTLDLAEDGSVDFSGLSPRDQGLRRYLPVTADGKPIDAEHGEEWLRAMPRSLHGSFCWAQEAR